MSGSIYGKLFRVSTWGESHGKGVGVVVDGCPAGLELSEEDIQIFLNRRKPGQSKFSTPRKEDDQVEILSGVFEGKTTGTPISMVVMNKTQRSSDYGDIATTFRPGHADYTFETKYGFRDYRGGGRSSGRETIARVAAGAIAVKILKSLGIEILTYTRSIGETEINYDNFDKNEINNNSLYMPDAKAAEKAAEYLENLMKNRDSSGGSAECIVSGMPVGIGETVFDKLDAELAKGVVSIGAVKAFEIGDGTLVSKSIGSVNNDSYIINNGKISKKTNHSGGILGGMSDGADIVIRAYFKPTPSIFQKQETVNNKGENTTIEIKGRHDPIIVPRAVVVLESMTAITIVDKLFENMSARLDKIVDFYK
jgi:chorismate synthase